MTTWNVTHHKHFKMQSIPFPQCTTEHLSDIIAQVGITVGQRVAMLNEIYDIVQIEFATIDDNHVFYIRTSDSDESMLRLTESYDISEVLTEN